MKKIILSTGLLLITLHFSMLFAYLMRPAPISNFYAYPFFQQDWNLFVPAPSAKYKLLLYDKERKQTKNVFDDILNKHQQNRLKGLGPALIALVNSIHYFEKNALEKGIKSGEVNKEDLNFNILKKILLNTNGYFYTNEGKNGFLIVLIVDEKNERRIYFSA